MKHKGIDYKTSTVQYYLNNNESMDKVCKIFNCKKTTQKYGFIITKTIKILLVVIENLYLIKLKRNK
jgi:nicotinic acid phosphoribosyltransferase